MQSGTLGRVVCFAFIVIIAAIFNSRGDCKERARSDQEGEILSNEARVRRLTLMTICKRVQELMGLCDRDSVEESIMDGYMAEKKIVNLANINKHRQANGFRNISGNW